jgi:hypothetical protein
MTRRRGLWLAGALLALAPVVASLGATAPLPPIRVDSTGHFFSDDQGRPQIPVLNRATEKFAPPGTPAG